VTTGSARPDSEQDRTHQPRLRRLGIETERSAYGSAMRWWRQYRQVWLALLIIAIFVAVIAVMVAMGTPREPPGG
jgi:hypothetical protein